MLSLFLWITLIVPFAEPSAVVIDGYADRISAFPGDSIELYLNASFKTTYNLRLYDLSGKPVYTVRVPISPQVRSNVKPSENGFGYRLTKKVAVPPVGSGVYMWDKTIPFVVKTRRARTVIVYPSNTINAYCNSGGKSLYGFNSSGSLRAEKVSFLRPMPLPEHAEAFFKWMKKEGRDDVGYIVDSDLDEYNSIRKAELLIIPGHNEYWTFQARKNFDRFINEGKNALIISGNTMWWQVRYNKTKDQLICYRDAKADPIRSEKLKTINWCEPQLRYPIESSTGTDFRNAGYGLKEDEGWNGYKIISASPLLQGTWLSLGDILPCPADEMDGVPIVKLENGTPIVDLQRLRFQRVEIIGYDLVSRGGNQGVGTWIVFKPNVSSGTVINTASTGWCAEKGIGSSRDIQTITRNMIVMLLNKQNVFSDEAPL